VGCYSVDQARSAYEQAVNGYTKEEREIAAANVNKAIADIAAVQSIIDQMVVYALVASASLPAQRRARRNPSCGARCIAAETPHRASFLP
jgi:hypothetical protein